MGRLLKLIFCALSLTLILNVSTFALANDKFSWYCKRNTEHLQPEIDAEMRFIEEYNGYYVDKSALNSQEKVIYLTFDAGYENGNIQKILDILKEENVCGSFFILENLLNKNPDLVMKMVENGNLVCNHTASHKDISRLSFDELKNELETMEKLFREKTGRELAKYFRPPEGRFSRESIKNISDLGYKTIFWSFAYADWDNNNQMPYDKAFDKVMSNIHNGAILLLHPTSATNVAILPKIIHQLKSEGYSFKTIDNL